MTPTINQNVVVLDRSSARFGEKALVKEIHERHVVVEYTDGLQEDVRRSMIGEPGTWTAISPGVVLELLDSNGLPLTYRVIERWTYTVLLSQADSYTTPGAIETIENLEQRGFRIIST